MNAQFVNFWAGDYPQFVPSFADELAAITAAEVARTVRATARMRAVKYEVARS